MPKTINKKKVKKKQTYNGYTKEEADEIRKKQAENYRRRLAEKEEAIQHARDIQHQIEIEKLTKLLEEHRYKNNPFSVVDIVNVAMKYDLKMHELLLYMIVAEQTQVIWAYDRVRNEFYVTTGCVLKDDDIKTIIPITYTDITRCFNALKRDQLITEETVYLDNHSSLKTRVLRAYTG